MSTLTAELAIKALDGLYTRQTVIAENVANASTVGYRPLKVTFEQALASAAAKGTDAVRMVRPAVEPDDPASSDPGVRLDQQLAAASTTELRYAALADILGRRSQLNELATTGSL